MVKLVLGTFLFLCLGLVAVVFFGPDHVRLERRAEVPAPPAEVYAVVADPHTWPSWTVYNLELDPQAVFGFEGRPAGDGAVITWNGPKLKAGAVHLRDCAAPRHVEYDLDLEHGRHVSAGAFELSPSPGGTTVVWTHDVELAGVSKLVAMVLDDLVGSQLERSLDGLRERFAPTPAAAQ